ncbi:MAG: hypothetical protein OXH57_02585 [Ekhidna sp.]|nr:hypothetical protein [Ekhidna sp.]
MKSKSFLTLSSLFLLVSLGNAQIKTGTSGNVGNNVIIILHDKSEIKGELVSDGEEEIVVKSETLSMLTLQKTEVKQIIYLESKDRLPNPNPTKYFIGQSAFNLSKGEGYYQNIYGFINIVEYGITDRFSAIAGTEILTLLYVFAPIFFTNLKYGVPIAKNLRGAASFSYLNDTGSLDDELEFASLNALLTYGNVEHNITFGTGYYAIGGEIDNTELLIISGMTRLTRRLAFITENYLLPEDDIAVRSAGLRYIAKKVTVDLVIFEEGIPAIDMVLKF